MSIDLHLLGEADAQHAQILEAIANISMQEKV